jgi:hypothetical protein
MADTQNDNQGQQPTGGSPIGPPQPIRVPNVGLIRRIFDRGTQDGTIQSGPVSPARKVQPLLMGNTSEAQPKPLSLQGAGMDKPRKAKAQPKPELVGKVEKGSPIQPIAVPEVSDIQALAPQRQLTEAEIEQNRAKYVPEAIENTIITARNSASDKTYFDNFVAPNLRKTLSEDIKSGELDAGLNKERYPVVTRRVDGLFENILQGAKDRGNTLIGLDEYDRLDKQGKIQFLSGKSTLRVPTLSQVGSPTRDLYSGQTTQEYQGAVPTERGALGEIAYGAGGVLPDIAAGIATAPGNLLVPGASLLSVGAIQGRTGRINAAQQAFQVAKTNGLNDEEALQVAENAEKTGAVTGTLEGVASQFFGNKILKAFAAPTANKALTGFVNQTKQFLKGAITTTGKSAAALASDMGVAGAMEIVRQNALADKNLENPNANKEILDNVKMEGSVALAFAIVGKLTKVPKYLQSYATSTLATLDPNDLVDYATEMELRGEAPAGFTDTVREEVKKYNDAKSSAGDVVDADIEPTIVGLIMKKKNLQDKLKEADDTIKPQIQAQIDELNTRITTTLDTKVPQEVDDKTQSKIEQDATKENEQVSTVQEGGTAESTGIIPGQQEVGQGEGSQRKATEQGANIGDSNIGSQAEVAPELDVAEKARQMASRLRSGETNVLPEWLRAELPEGAEVQGLDINNIYAKALEVFAETYEKLKDFKKAADKAFKEISGWFKKNNVKINEEDIKSKFESQLNVPTVQDTTDTNISESQQAPAPETTITEDDVVNYEADSEEIINQEKKASRTVNKTVWRKLLKAVDDNQVNVIKELRKTGRFSDLLVSALEAIRHTSADSNQRVNAFNKNVYEGLSDKPSVEINGRKFSEKKLLESVIKAKRLIEIQRMLGDKFNRFQQFDAEYNTALAEYEAIDEATAENKKKLDKVAEKINELNKRIVSANLDENNQEDFDKLVELVRDQHDKADAIMAEMESISEKNKLAVAKIRETRNRRQAALEYIANRGVLSQNQDGTYALGNYKMGAIGGVPYTINEAQAFLNAASKSDKFGDIDARSEQAFSAFKSILDEQYDAGLISQEQYDDLSKYKYVPIKYISSVLMDGNSAFMKSRGGANIKALTGGSDGSQITDYSTLFNIYATTALKNIATNKTLQLLEKAIKSELPTMKATNMYNQDIVVKLAETEKKKGIDKTDKFGNKVYVKPKHGFTNIKVYNKDGITMLTVPTWFSDEFYGNSEYNKGLSMLSSVLGVNLLRKSVTIANPAFGIAQLVTLDPIQAILTAKGFNPILPIAYGEIVAQWPSVAKSINKKDALYNEAVKNGVFGDMAARSGIDKFYDNAIFTGVKDIDDKIANKSIFEKVLFGADISKIPGIKQAMAFGESTVGASEKMTRLIVYKKSKKYFMDKGYSAEEAGQLAASEARNTANFSRAGDIIKQANHLIPYLSAAYATKRAVVKSFKRDPAKAMFVVSQMALGGMAVTLWSIGAMSDDEKEKEYWGEMYKALPDYYKKNYVVIRNPSHNIGDDITNAFIRIPLPFGAKEMYKGVISAKMGEYMDEATTPREAAISSILSTLDMVGLEDVSLPPLANALVKYNLNIDPYTGNKIVYDESTGEYSFLEEKQGTLPMIQAAAQKTRAFSAPRFQAAVQSYTGKFERNPFTQIVVNSLNSMYEFAAGKENSVIKSIKDDPNKLIESPLASVSGRFFATPTKYYKNKFNTILTDYVYSKLNSNFNQALIDIADKRKEKIGISNMTSNEQMDFFVKDAEKFLKDVERDLGKQEALKYEKKLRDARVGEIKDILKLKIVEDDSLKKLATETNPAIKGRAAYEILKNASDNPNKKTLIATALQATEFFRDPAIVGSYMERMLEDKFGTEYRDKFKSTLKGNRATAIEKMYRASKQFSSDSEEVRNEKIGMIDVMSFYIDSKNYDRTTRKGDTITERLFGFDYPRK